MKALRMLMIGAVVMVGASGAFGDMITFDLGYTFSGTDPAGAPPWIRAHFDDEGTAGSVKMTLSTLNLLDSEFVSDWHFNLDPSMDPTSLIFSAPIKTGAFTDPVISKGTDAYKANGDGWYDILVAFTTGTVTERFGPGDAVEYTITGIPTLTASSFNYLSKPGGGHGPYYTAAHVQAVSPAAAVGTIGGWVTVPEPATMAVVLIGALGWLGHRRRRK